MKEQWKPVEGFESIYEVSETGRVRSLDREVSTSENSRAHRKWTARGKELTPTGNGRGYLIVGLCDGEKRVNRYVHRLVAEAFIGSIDGLEVDHIDDDKANNAASNLRVCTRKQNVRNQNKNVGCSGFLGVVRKNKGWRGIVHSDGKRKYTAVYSAPMDAAIARDELAKKIHGDFARLNFA